MELRLEESTMLLWSVVLGLAQIVIAGVVANRIWDFPIM